MKLLLELLDRVPASWIQAAGICRGRHRWIKATTDWLPNLIRNREGQIQKGLGRGLRLNPGQSTVGFLLGTHDFDVQFVMSKLLKPGMTVYDIGANIGFTAVLAARQVSRITLDGVGQPELVERRPCRVRRELVADALVHQIVRWALEQKGDLLRCVEVWHAPLVTIPEFEAQTRAQTFSRGVGLPGRVWESAAPAWIPDVTVDENFPRAATAVREGLRGALGFPVLVGTHCIGVMEFFSGEIQQPDTELAEAPPPAPPPAPAEQPKRDTTARQERRPAYTPEPPPPTPAAPAPTESSKPSAGAMADSAGARRDAESRARAAR